MLRQLTYKRKPIVQFYNFSIRKDFSSQDEFLFLAGSRSGDTTYGGAYNDNIRGYDGDDTLVAGSGRMN